jgi:hypothetical protein
MADLLEQDLTSGYVAPTVEDLSVDGMDPEMLQLINPLLARRRALSETYNKQFDDYNRLSDRAEKAQAGGGLSAGQGLASVLVGLLPTLVAGAFGGKRAAGQAAASGVQGIGTYQALARESQKADLQRLLGLTNQQQRLLSQTANQATGVDKAITSTVANRTTAQERNERMAERNDLAKDRNRTYEMLGLMNADIRRASMAGKDTSEPMSDALSTALDALDKGEQPDLKKLNAKERKEFLSFRQGKQRDNEEDRRVNQAISSESAKIKSEWKSLNGEDLIDQASAISELKLLRKDPSALSDTAIKRLLARAQGEKGAMSNQDISMTLSDSMAADAIKAKNYLLNGQTSAITEAQAKALDTYLNNKANAIGENIDAAKEELKGRLSQVAPETLRKKSIEEVMDSYGNTAKKRLGIGKMSVSEMQKSLEESRKRTEALMAELKNGG